MEQVIEYKYSEEVLPLIKKQLENIPQEKLYIFTGLAGLGKIKEEVMEYAVENKIVENAKELGALIGVGNDLDIEGGKYTQFILSGLDNVKFKIDMSYDNIPEEEWGVNPILQGYRLSSRNYLITSRTDSKTGITKLVATQ